MSPEPGKNFCGAIDVGGTKISSALFTARGRLFCRNKVLIDKSHARQPVRQIIDIIEDFQDQARSEKGKVLAVGIAIPGVVFRDRGVVWAPNIPGWDHFPLQEKIRAKTRIPLVFDSDRSACVLGERWCGAARGLNHVVFLAVGTGIGAGIIVDGKLYRGSEDIAGAVGWFALHPRFQKEYTEMGCFEAEASGNSVARKAIQGLKAGEKSVLQEMVEGRPEGLRAQDVFAAAGKGDALSLRIIRNTIQYLAMGTANMVSLLNPEMVVLGGGLFQAGRLLLEPIRKEFKRWAQPLAAQKVRIELSRLGEDAGLYGAGKLAWESC